jgi:streptogramin lyase
MPSAERKLTRLPRLLAPCAIAVACAAAVAGCASRGRQSIPSGASVVRAGTGTIDYEAKHDGDVWVYDADTGKLIYMGEIRKDQAVRVNARSDQVTVGGKTVSERAISDEHKYQIFYRRD